MVSHSILALIPNFSIANLLSGYAVAAGLIAGEGIGGVINAVFQIAGISGPEKYGSTVGCPAGLC